MVHIYSSRVQIQLLNSFHSGDDFENRFFKKYSIKTTKNITKIVK